MTLKEFREYVERAEVTTFKYGLSDPFSWRGSYDEVAFAVLEQPMTKQEVLAKIDKAYEDTFYGYKGGEYTYKDYTDVHFEEGVEMYTGGDYCAAWIAKIEGNEVYPSQEARLAKLAFSA